jgi:hypothetical protein
MGQNSAVTKYTYTLQPRDEGKYVIGSIKVVYGGKEYRTDPIEVEVVSGSVLPRAGRRSPGGFADPFDMISPFGRRERRAEADQGEVFITASLSKPEVFVGEQVVLTYRLYSQIQIMGLQVDEQPSLTGFWVENVELPDQPEIKETTVRDKPFWVVEVKKNILFPTRAGEITVDRTVFSMGARVDSGSFFGPMTETIRRSTEPVTLKVKPLPTTGKPADFSGAVGQFKLSADLDKKQTPAGEPLTLSVRLEGQGNLKTVEPPGLPPLPGFRTYDPETEDNLEASASGLSGDKQWEYVLVPDTAGRKQIEPLTFSYFDPDRNQYVELRTDPLVLEVAAPAVASAGGGAGVTSRGAVQVLRQDIRYLKSIPQELGRSSTPFYRSGVFYASLMLPFLWNVGLVVYRWKRQSEAAQAGLYRSRRAQRLAQQGLKQARKLARAESGDFYEETAASLYRYVADKLGVSPSGLTTQSIGSVLEERQVPESIRSDFIAAIDACEFARFTPGERSREDMEPLLERAEKIIISLEKHFG